MGLGGMSSARWPAESVPVCVEMRAWPAPFYRVVTNAESLGRPVRRVVEFCFCLWLNKLGQSAVSYDPRGLGSLVIDSLPGALPRGAGAK